MCAFWGCRAQAAALLGCQLSRPTFANLSKDVVHCLGDDAAQDGGLLLALHGEGLAAACLAISKDGACSAAALSESGRLQGIAGT